MLSIIFLNIKAMLENFQEYICILHRIWRNWGIGNHSPSTYNLCDLGLVAWCLCASVSPWEDDHNNTFVCCEEAKVTKVAHSAQTFQIVTSTEVVFISGKWYRATANLCAEGYTRCGPLTAVRRLCCYCDLAGPGCCCKVLSRCWLNYFHA